MGCLNYNEGFPHWFGNIHLSGPCNRSCYFCIGQHMMALDPINNLSRWPLKGMREFLGHCLGHGIREINVTGSNTDPLLYEHTRKLKDLLKYVYILLHTELFRITGSIQKNGILKEQSKRIWKLSRHPK